MHDQVISMLVVPLVADVIADIVQAEFPRNRALAGEAPTQIAKPEMGMHTVTAK